MATRIKAKNLRPGDVYRGGLHKAITVRKRGAWVFVTYAYRVADERGRESFHRQAIPPVEKLHVNKLEEVLP